MTTETKFSLVAIAGIACSLLLIGVLFHHITGEETNSESNNFDGLNASGNTGGTKSIINIGNGRIKIMNKDGSYCPTKCDSTQRAIIANHNNQSYNNTVKPKSFN